MAREYTIGAVAALMRDASKSTTYKAALLKALARLAQSGDATHISLTRIGEEFVRLYWNQTVVFHLRQAAVLSKEAVAVKLIRETASAARARSFQDLPAPDRRTLAAKMAKLLTVNVLEAFHASAPISMDALYSWERSDDHITVSRESSAFLRKNLLPLDIIANYHWADFLEGCNRLAPRIVQKVSRDAARRSSLLRYMTLLSSDGEAECFYCGIGSGAGTLMQVDHVIPWSFLLEDPLWDLVVACRRCNASKSDWLPEPAFLDKLKRRNFERPLLGGKVSALVSEPDIDRLYNAAISVEWPGFWAPGS